MLGTFGTQPMFSLEVLCQSNNDNLAIIAWKGHPLNRSLTLILVQNIMLTFMCCYNCISRFCAPVDFVFYVIRINTGAVLHLGPVVPTEF